MVFTEHFVEIVGEKHSLAPGCVARRELVLQRRVFHHAAHLLEERFGPVATRLRLLMDDGNIFALEPVEDTVPKQPLYEWEVLEERSSDRAERAIVPSEDVVRRALEDIELGDGRGDLWNDLDRTGRASNDRDALARERHVVIPLGRVEYRSAERVQPLEVGDRGLVQATAAIDDMMRSQRLARFELDVPVALLVLEP